jgi:hypothetical protein
MAIFVAGVSEPFVMCPFGRIEDNIPRFQSSQTASEALPFDAVDTDYDIFFELLKKRPLIGVALKRQEGGNLREGDARRIPPKRNVHWKSCYLRKRVVIISVKWPLLLFIREALAYPKKKHARCGNSELLERIRVKVLWGVTLGYFLRG